MKVLFVSLQILMVVSSWYFDTGVQALSTLSHLHEHHHETHDHDVHESFNSSRGEEKVVSLTHSHSHSDEETAKKQSDGETHEHRIPVNPSNSNLYISFVDYELSSPSEVSFVPEVDEDFLISSHYIQGVFRPPIA